MIIYVGDARDVIRRILSNHYTGNVEASALRRAIAEEMGYPLRRTKRKSGSIRVRIDLPFPREQEKMISEYILNGEWKYVICESYSEAHDFQWYVIEQLKPLLNRKLKSWSPQRTRKYEYLLTKLLKSRSLSRSNLKKMQSGPGVYVLFHKQKIVDFRNEHRIFECNRPENVSPEDWPDCRICLYAKCGYSKCFEPNPRWKEQNGICKHEHCIENMPFTHKEASCPIFGHDCPSGTSQVTKCKSGLSFCKVKRNE